MRCWLDTLSLVPHVPWLLKPSLLGCLGYRYIPHLAADPGALQCVFLLSQDLNSLGTLPPPLKKTLAVQDPVCVEAAPRVCGYQKHSCF